MDLECWKTKLSALDLVRECSAPTSGDSCWLCDQLEAWNSVLEPLQLQLAEQEQGVLCLYSYSCKAVTDTQELDTPYNTAFFIAWLPRKHACVEELKVNHNLPCIGMVAISDPVASAPSQLRRISITGEASSDWCLLLDTLDARGHLEGLELTNLEVSDSLASKLAQLLLDNADSMRAFSLTMPTISSRAFDTLMSGLSKCGKLKELSFDNNFGTPGLRDFTKLLLSTETLQDLCLVEQSSDGMNCDVAINYEENNKAMLAAVSHLLMRNVALTEFRYRGIRDKVTGILRALESNDVLKCLTINAYDTMPTDQCPVVGAELKSMLEKNKGLRSLILEDFDIDYHLAGPMSEGLQQNTTLEHLDLGDSILSCSALHSLCTALGVNRTLRSLKVGYYRVEASERRVLSAELARWQCYGRVQMRWHHWDTPGLSSALLEPSGCPTVLNLNTLHFTATSFSAVCRAVASSTHLEELNVVFCKADSDRVESVCGALRENKSLKRMTLREDSQSQNYVTTTAQCLISNERITQLELHCNSIDEASADVLASLLVENKSIWTLTVSTKNTPTPACKDTLSRAFAQNHFITAFYFSGSREDLCDKAMDVALVRNIKRLRQAARFVVGKNREKVCAESFEHFRSKEQLLLCATFISGMGEAEERAAERAAELFIERNYLTINRVVRHKVECHAGRGTQIDRLNYECWLAIARYLKVSDIV